MQDTIHLSRCRRVGAAGARLVSGSWLRAFSRPRPRLEVLLLPLPLVLLVAGWQVLVWIAGYPAFILPSPADVAVVGVRVIANGTLWHHMRVTLSEVGAGLLLGLLAASLLGYPLAKSRRLERLAAPYLVVSQSVPVVAIAPLLA